jgi:L-seryl-tRNA(Ser) seleniumtransferase
MDGNLRGELVRLPSMERLLQGEAAGDLLRCYGRPEVVDALRESLAALRDEIRAGKQPACDIPEIADRARERLEAAHAARLKPVFNLTGTVLHTNLGRATLPAAVVAAVAAVAGGASNLEFDLGTGKRGDRDAHVEEWLCRLTGAEAATIVNNNAAAVLLLLNTLALRKHVLVSRGELVEIGGSFRMPEIMARAGCVLREVGATNRTHLHDFAQAVGPRTGLIMKVHASNYRIEGFTAEVEEKALAALARERGIPFAVDLGSGSLVDLSRYGLPHEPTVGETLRAGADLVAFSGDKLLGGPQAGLIVGRRDLIARLKRNPLKRALRCDKMTIAALAALLPLHADPERLPERLPALRLLTRSAQDIAALAASLRPTLSGTLDAHAEVSIVPCMSQIGSGALPVELLPSAGLRIAPRERVSARRIAAALRGLPIPVIGRIEGGAVILDLRCLEDPDAFAAQLPRLGAALSGRDA